MSDPRKSRSVENVEGRLPLSYEELEIRSQSSEGRGSLRREFGVPGVVRALPSEYFRHLRLHHLFREPKLLVNGRVAVYVQGKGGLSYYWKDDAKKDRRLHLSPGDRVELFVRNDVKPVVQEVRKGVDRALKPSPRKVPPTRVEVTLDDDFDEFDRWAKTADCRTLTTLSRKDVRLTPERIQLRGHSYRGKTLTVEDYFRAGLGPEYKLQMGESPVYFSKMYHIDDGRLAIVAYMPKESGSYVARSYYLSNSQGAWRYLPSYHTDRNGSIAWYSKGFGEESMTLPFSLQADLSKILKKDASSVLRVPNSEAFFASTAKHLRRGHIETYTREVSPRPRLLKGNLKNPSLRLASDPASLTLAMEEEPDFAQVLDSWDVESSLYGQIHFETFLSKDRSLRYLFCRDLLGRVWIGGVEDVSGNRHSDLDIQSVGLFKNWVQASALTVPAYEYGQQAEGFGNWSMCHGHYVDMYTNYLSKIPVIQKYNKHVRDQENTRVGVVGRVGRWFTDFGQRD